VKPLRDVLLESEEVAFINAVVAGGSEEVMGDDKLQCANHFLFLPLTSDASGWFERRGAAGGGVPAEFAWLGALVAAGREAHYLPASSLRAPDAVKERGIGALEQSARDSDESAAASVAVAEKKPEDNPTFVCRKCRRMALFRGEHVLNPDCHRCESTTRGDRSACSFFVGALGWMEAEIHGGERQGKLACPHCRAKLGSWSWVGLKCGCGGWHSPGVVH
jgi:dual specificity phosphatase 12